MIFQNATRIVDAFPISRLIIGSIYFSQGIGNSAECTLYLVTNDFFIAAPAYAREDGALQLKEQLSGTLYCDAIYRESVMQLSVNDGYRVLTDFSASEESKIVNGSKSNHGYIRHAFFDHPSSYLPKVEPLLKVLLASQKANRTFMFNVVSIFGEGIEDVEAIVPGRVMDDDDMSKVDSFYDLMETVPELETVEVKSTLYLIGEGETENMPEHLIEEISRYDVSDFICLECVDEAEEYSFTVDTENFR